MNKREMLHTILDSILDIEESSKKGVRLNLSGNFCHLYFKTIDKSGAEDIGTGRMFFFNTENTARDFTGAVEELERIQGLPDVEPKVSVLMTEEKARELGLIA